MLKSMFLAEKMNFAMSTLQNSPIFCNICLTQKTIMEKNP